MALTRTFAAFLLCALAACPRQQEPVPDGKEPPEAEPAAKAAPPDAGIRSPGPADPASGGASAPPAPGAAAPAEPAEAKPAEPAAPAEAKPAAAERAAAHPGGRTRTKGGAAPKAPRGAESSGPADGGSAAAPDPALGRTVWMKKCKGCHGADGKADTKMGRKHEIPDVTTAEWKKTWTVAKIRKTVAAGVPGTKMRPFAKKLSAEEIEAVARFMRAL